jgi:hypothetical protein
MSGEFKDYMGMWELQVVGYRLQIPGSKPQIPISARDFGFRISDLLFVICYL